MTPDGTEFFQQTGAWLVETTRVPAEAWVLDVGCGKGAVALPAARAVGPQGHVLGIDLAAPMLAHARDRAQQARLSNVSFREGDAADLAWEPDTFDVVLGANVVQFLPRTAKTVTRWGEVLVPGGLLGSPGPWARRPAGRRCWPRSTPMCRMGCRGSGRSCAVPHSAMPRRSRNW